MRLKFNKKYLNYLINKKWTSPKHFIAIKSLKAKYK